jgi:sulfur relay protein TusB/DsrH
MKEIVTPQNSCLHLVSGTDPVALSDCRAQCVAGDVVLFLDAGVLHLLDENLLTFDAGIAVYYSPVDLEARGLLEAAVHSAVQLASDEDFVRLLEHCSHCLSWQ